MKIPLVDEILDQWKGTIGDDFVGYKNHVYRMIHFCLYLKECTDEEKEKIYIAGAFHDIGIWTNNTVDYLPPSVELAQNYLQKNNKEEWSEEITLIIDLHHKLRKCDIPEYPLVELFRQGDLVDFSLGMASCGVPKSFINDVKSAFPNAGFHKMLLKIATIWFFKHPLNPAPMMKW